MITIRQIGLDAAINLLDALPSRLEVAMREWLKAVTEHARKRAAANAPLFKQPEGLPPPYLRENITVLPARREGRGFQSGLWSFAVNASARGRSGGGIWADYAYLMHEFQTPAAAAQFGLGPYTREEPPTPEGGPGGRYLNRVFLYHWPGYEKVLGRFVEGCVRGRTVQADLPADGSMVQ